MFNMRRTFLPHMIPSQRIIIEENRQPKMKKVNQYTLRSKLGSGSSSKVYLACDETTGAFYAVKAIHILEHRHNGTGAAGLEREIRIMRKLNHHNIVKLVDVLYASTVDTAYMVIEWANCGTMQDLIERIYGGNQNNQQNRFSEADLASIFKQVIEGLSYLHSKGIIHKDIKPSNILIFSDGSAKLSDFGIGHSFQSAEAVVGTPAYQAPELFEDEEDYEEDIDPTKGDIWSLGVSLYEAAFGKLPYVGANLYEIVRSINMTKLDIPENEYSSALISIIQLMLTVDSSKRPTLDEVKNHEFFKLAEENPKWEFQTMMPKAPLPDSKVVIVPAVVCPENFSFVADLKSYSCPDTFPPIIDQFDSPIIEKSMLLDNCNNYI
ncbi:Serine/threonine-protein kinase stk11 [Tritrichomonas foetus]|uniref:Serine/threonine-protein kinase stk11 n=1 Tax=Tritrichomonas foetus TaxID=1144522 RepID=A0A1J4JQS9_9EUKA|nr:Serine/threonine-protein kinase stk11 [Tritrichomonas foetus]|eukprot:OHT01090.1 Serine/threonine-protein kinase stk11 [Tritrichomonas foetus]